MGKGAGFIFSGFTLNIRLEKKKVPDLFLFIYAPFRLDLFRKLQQHESEIGWSTEFIPEKENKSGTISPIDDVLESAD